MNITIRKATVEDYKSVYELIREFSFYVKTPEKLSITIDQMIRDQEDFRCMVAVDQDKIVGYALYFFAYYSWSGKSLYLDDLYIHESYRGQQIGTKLMDSIVAFARENNCKKMRWQVSNWNKKAIEFYKNRGAVIDDVEINCDFIL